MRGSISSDSASDLRKVRDEQGHYLRERHRALCGTLLNPRTIYRRVTSKFFIHGCSMTKNLLLGSIAGNFLPVEDQQRCAKPPRFAQGTSGGLSLRRYQNGKLLIKPSATAIKRFRKRLAGEFRALRGANAAAVLAKTVPITRGWSAYYKTAVSARVFIALDAHLWKLTSKWACWTHPNKPKRWTTNRYYRKFSKFRNDRWVFGNPETGAYLPKLSWTPIVRHTLVKGGASPDDPSLAQYWARRRQKVKPPLDPYVVRLLSRQDGRCGLCGENLLTPDQPPQSPEGWERWFLQVVKLAITADYLAVHGRPAAGNDDRTHLVHATCRRRQQPAWRQAGGTVLGLCT